MEAVNNIFKNKEFSFLILGTFLVNFGIRTCATMMTWWIFELTKEPIYIGYLGLVEIIPAIVFALWAGHLVDVLEKTKLLRLCIIGFLLIYGGLLYISYINHTDHNKKIVIFSIYLLVFFSGFIRAFSGPTLQSLVSFVLPRFQIPQGVSWQKAQFFISKVCSHIISGFLIYFLSYFGTMIFVFVLIVIGGLFLIKIKPKPILKHKDEEPVFQSIKNGLHFVFNKKEILGPLSLDLFAVLFGGVVGVLPVYAADILHCSSIGFGWLNAASDIGGIITILYCTKFPLKSKQGLKLLLAVGVFGISILVFGVSTNFYLSLITLFISGLADGISMVTRGSIVQLFTPLSMQGRVLSINSIFINSSNELGQFESGFVAEKMGTVPSVIFGGIMTISIVIFTFINNKKLRNLEYSTNDFKS